MNSSVSPPSISLHALTVHKVGLFHLLNCRGLNAVFNPLHIALSPVKLVEYVIKELPQDLSLKDYRLNDWRDSLAEVMEIVFRWQIRVVFKTVQNVGVGEDGLLLNRFTHTILDEYLVQRIVVFGELCQILRIFDRVTQLLNLHSLEILR